MWGTIVGGVVSVIDKIIPDPKAAAEAKIRLLELEQKGQLTELQEAASIIKTEAAGEGSLQRNWRPLVMLTFTALIVCRWLGISLNEVMITPELEMKLFEIVQLGLGGYVIGRSAEKLMKTYSDTKK
jgi:hypothetical protein